MNHRGCRRLETELANIDVKQWWVEIPGAVSSGARIIGDMFNEADPGRIASGLYQSS